MKTDLNFPQAWCAGALSFVIAASQVVWPVPTAIAAKPAPVTRLNLLIKKAKQHYPGLRAAQHAIEAAEAQLREATISPFFQFQATAAFGVAPEQRGTAILSPDSQLPLSNSWFPVLRVGVEGAIPLYTFGKLTGARNAAQAGIQAARHARRQSIQTLTLQVRQAYYALQLALDTQQLINEGKGRLEQATQLLNDKLDDEDEDADATDRWRLGAVVAEVSAQSAQVNRAKRAAEHALRLLTGLRTINVPECPLQPLPFKPKSLQHYRISARRHRPEAGMLHAAIEARQAELGIHRARYFPDLALALRASHSYAPGITDQSNAFIIDNGNFTSLQAALVARWSFDIWGNVQRVDRSQSQLAQLREQKREAELGMAIQTSALYEKVESAKQQIDAWEKGMREMRAWFVASAQGYQLGTLEAGDLIDAVKAYFKARFSYLNSVFEYNMAIAELEQASGRSIIARQAWESQCYAE